MLLFYVLLTVHLSIFILEINQLDAQNLFYNKFISCLYMFRARCAHRQEVKILLYSLWCHHTYKLITKIKIHAVYCFIVLLIGSTCFGHYYVHHQELTIIMVITTVVVSFLGCRRLNARCG